MIIRINLHPDKKAKAESSPGTAVMAVLILLGMCIAVGFMFVSQDIEKETKKFKSEANQIQAQIDEVNSRIKDVKEVQTKISELEARMKILGRLTSNRVGPQYVLNELSRLMANPRDVISRKEANELGWTVAWEPDNIVLEGFKDIGNNTISINGISRSMEDIQELWTRMKTSTILRNIKLIEIKDMKSSGSTGNAQAFVFEAEANFNYRTKDGRALVESLTHQETVDSAEPSANVQNQEN